MPACKQCSSAFEHAPDEAAFLDSVAPVFAGKKELIPLPTHCPDCRLQRRMAWRNDRTLHHRKCDASGKQIISMYSPDKPHKVYDIEEWWKDTWSALDYGRAFDFTKTFAEQFDALSRDVPHQSLYMTNAVNSDYTNHTLNMNDCFLIGGGGNCENCMYGRFVVDCKDTVDATSLYGCQWCYEGVASQNCYQCAFFTYCRSCSDCIVIEDCLNCKNCIACFGLNNAEYRILNEQLTKDEFEKRKSELLPLTREKIDLLLAQLAAFRLTLPHRHGHIVGSENCTGDMVFNSKDCMNCFDVNEGEDCVNVSFSPKCSHSRDLTFTAPDAIEWSYEGCATVGMQKGLATFLAWYGSNVLYSTECNNCNDCFGCVGLHHKNHCIFNMQYTKQQYEELVPRIIAHMRTTGEWGEFLPVSSSRFCYNESVAADYFPMTKEQVLARGWKWFDGLDTREQYMGDVVEIPATIGEATDDIVKKILRCEVTGRPFKITPQELKFYRTLALPLPRRSPDQRHAERLLLRNPRKLWKRTCGKCGKEIESNIAPERPEIVYCEPCYLDTVY